MDFGRPESRPLALARTGSKSTNQLLKIAVTIASSVSFIRRFSSILLSNVLRTWAIAFCWPRGGNGTGISERMRWLRFCIPVPQPNADSLCRQVGERRKYAANRGSIRLVSGRKRMQQPENVAAWATGPRYIMERPRRSLLPLDLMITMSSFCSNWLSGICNLELSSSSSHHCGTKSRSPKSFTLTTGIPLPSWWQPKSTPFRSSPRCPSAIS